MFILGRRKCLTVMSFGCSILLHSSMFICNARAFSRSLSFLPWKKMNFNNRQIWKAGRIGGKCISSKDLKRTAPATIAFVCIVYHETGLKEREIFRHEAFFSNTWARRRRAFVDLTGFWNKAITELRYNCEQSFTLVVLHYFSILCSWVFQVSCPLSLLTYINVFICPSKIQSVSYVKSGWVK